MVVAERKAAKPKNNPPRVHFEKLLDAPCTHHEGPINHALKDCNLMKKFLTRTLKRAPEVPKKPEEDQNNNDGDAGYPREDGAVMMIFGGSPARLTRPDPAGGLQHHASHAPVPQVVRNTHHV